MGGAMSRTGRILAAPIALSLLLIAGCAGLDPPMYVEGELVGSRGEVPQNCVLVVTDSVEGREFTAPVSATFAHPFTLYPDDREYRFRVTCDGHQTYDSDWRDLRENRRTGESVPLGRIALRPR
jgi:hypothetical protein